VTSPKTRKYIATVLGVVVLIGIMAVNPSLATWRGWAIAFIYPGAFFMLSTLVLRTRQPVRVVSWWFRASVVLAAILFILVLAMYGHDWTSDGVPVSFSELIFNLFLLALLPCLLLIPPPVPLFLAVGLSLLSAWMATLVSWCVEDSAGRPQAKSVDDADPNEATPKQ